MEEKGGREKAKSQGKSGEKEALGYLAAAAAICQTHSAEDYRVTLREQGGIHKVCSIVYTRGRGGKYDFLRTYFIDAPLVRDRAANNFNSDNAEMKERL